MTPHVPPSASARINWWPVLLHLYLCPLPSASLTPTPEYCGTNPRPQINSSVNISLIFSIGKLLEKNHYFISPEKYLKFLNITHMLVCVYMLLVIRLRNLLHHCWNSHKVCSLHLVDASLVPFSLWVSLSTSFLTCNLLFKETRILKKIFFNTASFHWGILFSETALNFTENGKMKGLPVPWDLNKISE